MFTGPWARNQRKRTTQIESEHFECACLADLFKEALQYRRRTYINPRIRAIDINQPELVSANMLSRTLSAIYWDLRTSKSSSKAALRFFPKNPTTLGQVYQVHQSLQRVLASRTSNPKTGHIYNMIKQEMNEDLISIRLENCQHNCQLTSLARRHRFTIDQGWGLASILTYSQTFFLASMILNETSWKTLVQMLTRAKPSICLFATSERIEWRSFIGRYLITKQGDTDYLDLNFPFDDSIIDPYGRSHPYLRLNGAVTVASYRNRIMIRIDENEPDLEMLGTQNIPPALSRSFDASRWPVNPLLLSQCDTNMGLCCMACNRHIDLSRPCACHPSSICYNPMVEIFETRDRGRGIRTLEDIPSGVLIAEYIGRIGPDTEFSFDDVYPLTFETQYPPAKEGGPVRPRATVTIASDEVGNWTRFMNHSCDATADIMNCNTTPVGDSFRQLIRAKERVIPAFTELTLDYGIEYFGPNRLCRCGTMECYANSVEQAAFNATARQELGNRHVVLLKHWVLMTLFDHIERYSSMVGYESFKRKVLSRVGHARR